jgi:hypothetical protein
MKRNVFLAVVILYILPGSLFGKAFGTFHTNHPWLSSTTGIINSQDSLVFDFSKASCSSAFVDVPVYFKADDDIYAIDFSIKINPARIAFHSVLTHVPGFIVSAYYQASDSTLRFTSFSFEPLLSSDSLLSIRFNSTSYPRSADFTQITSYLNGDHCSNKIIPVQAAAGIVASGPVSFPQGDSVKLTATGAGNRYAWSTGDTSQAIVVFATGQYIVSVTTTGGCATSASIEILVLSPLPVELLSFRAAKEEGGILLSWSTASEINNDHFTVERSTDNLSWKALVEIPGAGTTSATTNYRAIDERPLFGINYYRLKQTDFDGRSGYTPGIFCLFKTDDSILLFSSPSADKIQLRVSEDATIHIFDGRGAVVLKENIPGNESVELESSSWPNGVYLLKAQNDFFTETRKIIVRH